MAEHRATPAPPLVVDVDGTLVAGDLLIEGMARLLAAKPSSLVVLVYWTLLAFHPARRVALKRRVAEAVHLPPETLALNPAVLAEIDSAKQDGRDVYLASGADELALQSLGDFVGAVGCLGSDGRTNLVGHAKAHALTSRFGPGQFDYIGNERRDLPVWEEARHAIGVGLPPRLVREVRTLDEKARFLPGPDSAPLSYVWAMRPHQWVKNLLVFAPLIASHDTRVESVATVAILALALSACASGTYILNDLLDLQDDRRHRSKRFRPIAAGALSLPRAAFLATTLIAAASGVAFTLSVTAGLCVLLYLVATIAYSLRLKRAVFLDVVSLSVLYAIRVFSGAAVVSIALSPWFLTFTTFIFLTLAIVKRQIELSAAPASDSTLIGAERRGYFPADLTALTALSSASAVGSLLVLALYLHDPAVSARYDHPEYLASICLLLLFWLGRLIVLANRGVLDDDPVAFALRDRSSWIIATAIGTVYVLAL